MSRIGRMPVAIPAGVTVTIAEGNKVTVKGPKGTLERELPVELTIEEKDGHVIVSRPNDLKRMKSLHGLTRTLINNMIVGVTNGYEKVLEVNGVGYRAAKQGKKLTLNLGYSHPVEMEDPEGIETVLDGQNKITVKGIDKEKDTDLKKAYLNMAPSQTLKWIEQGKDPSEQNVEIEGTEPYIVGGHTASGYWVNTKRETTIYGLYAAGDVAGGCPQKYVTGALVEGEIAALDIVEKLKTQTFDTTDAKEEQLLDDKVKEYNHILSDKDSIFTIEQMEEAMQKVMDAYAGGISSHYQFNENCLNLAKEKINNLITLSGQLSAQDYHELMFYYELKERLTICLTLIEHLKARKETRWHSFAENLDHPQKSDDWKKYVNTKKVDGKIKVILRELVKEDEHYEHQN